MDKQIRRTRRRLRKRLYAFAEAMAEGADPREEAKRFVSGNLTMIRHCYPMSERAITKKVEDFLSENKPVVGTAQHEES